MFVKTLAKAEMLNFWEYMFAFSKEDFPVCSDGYWQESWPWRHAEYQEHWKEEDVTTSR